MSGKRLRAASWSGLFGAVLAAGVLTGSVAAHASTTWMVDNTNSGCNNSGANAGTPGQPVRTIAAAAAATNVVAGDTVLVNAGTYNEISAINPANSGNATAGPITFCTDGINVEGTAGSRQESG
jgi:acyl dehydratase